MGNVGRYFCVALPLLLTIASIISLLIATLAGVTHNSLHTFHIDITDLSVDTGSIKSVIDDLHIRSPTGEEAVLERASGNVTAIDLGLPTKYDVDLWGYCSFGDDGKRSCTKPKFDWAVEALNISFIEDFGTVFGVDINLPENIQNALKAFRTVTKWTEVAFVAALAVSAFALVVGIFATCSRAVSCLTWLIASLAAILVIASAGLATATASVVVGALEGTAKIWGARASVGTNFLIAVWASAAFAIAAAIFWLATVCCCKPERRQRNRGSKYQGTDQEKFLPSGAYAPIGNDNEAGYNNYSQSSFAPQYNRATPQYGQVSGYDDHSHNDRMSQYSVPEYNKPPQYSHANARSEAAYEPFTHRQ